MIYSVVIELEFFKTCFYFLFYIFDILFELIIQLIRMLQKVIIKNNSFKYIPKEQNKKRQKKTFKPESTSLISPMEADIIILLLPPLPTPSPSTLRALLLGASRRSVRLVVSPLCSILEASVEDWRRRDLVRPSSLERRLCQVSWFTLLSAIKIE